VFLVIVGIGVLYVIVPNIQYRYEDEIGFILGEKEFSSFGYGRGGLWIKLLDGFLQQDILPKLIGNYGLGNPENQFLGVLFWYGYIGLVTFMILITYLTVALLKRLRDTASDSSCDSDIQCMFACIIVASYWIAGLGNAFNLQITVQWMLWTWTGILLSDNTQKEPIAGGNISIDYI